MRSGDYDWLAEENRRHCQYSDITPLDLATMLGQQVHPAFRAGVQEPPLRTPTFFTEDYIAAECRAQAEREAAGYDLALSTERHRRWKALFRAMRRAVEQAEMDYGPACEEEWL